MYSPPMNCIVFGGTRGIGAAISRVFLQENCKVAVASSNVENVNSFIGDSSQVIGRTCDVTDEHDVNDFVSFVRSEYGRIDVVVNAAGITRDALLMKAKSQDIHEQINVNLVGTIFSCRAVIKPMIKQKSGCIINFGSIVGRSGNAGQSVYSATKAGLEGFTKSLAKEVGSRGVRVNLIAPGFIRTDMTKDIVENDLYINHIPLRRYGEPLEVAQLAYFLTSAHYMTGQVLCIDGGLQL